MRITLIPLIVTVIVLQGCAVSGVAFGVESNIPGVTEAIAKAQAKAALAACGDRTTEARKSAELSVTPRELPGMHRERIEHRFVCP